MPSAEEVVTTFDRLRSENRFHKERMRQVAEVVNGDIVIPLPELAASEKPAVANLAYRGLQTMSQNLSSVQPNTIFGPLKATEGERKAAQLRMRVADYWDQEDRTALLDAQRARYIFGYGSSPVRVDVDFVNERPVRSVPSPLVTYAPRPRQANDITPDFGIAASKMPVSTLLRRYGGNPQVVMYLRDYADRPEQQFWVLDYADAEEFHLVLGGVATDLDTGRFLMPGEEVVARGLTLHNVPNKTEMCPWVCPGLVNLDKDQGHFDQMLGMYHAQALLTALELQHAARSVFQESWLVSRDGGVAEVVTPADPLSGQVGVLRGGDLQIVSPDPQFHTHMVQDRLQEAGLMTGGIPPDMMGRGATNVRTGRRGDQIMSAAQDPVLQEAQTIMAESRQEEIRRQIAFDKAYLNKSKTIHVTWRGRVSENTYKAKELWLSDRCIVKYPIPGMDSSSLLIMVGQMLGLEMMSKREAREILPFFDDPDGSADLVTVEQLERSFMANLAMQLESPESPLQPRHVAELIKRVRDKDEDLVDAYQKVLESAQKEQTQAVPEGDPNLAPGLDGPGAIPPPVEGPSLGTDNVADLFGRLRMPSMQVRTPTGGLA